MDRVEYEVTSLNFPSAEVEEEIKKSAKLYGEMYTAAASQSYADSRAKAQQLATEALAATEGLSKIEPEVLLAHPDCIETLCHSCLPPLTRDKLSALSGVPARRISDLEAGKVPQRGTARRQMALVDLPAICEVLRSNIDPMLAPWCTEGRECRGYETERFAALVAERGAITRARATGALIADQMKSKLVSWVAEQGYSEHDDIEIVGDTKIMSFKVPSNLPQGMYVVRYCRVSGGRPSEVVFVRSAKTGELLGFEPKLFPDPNNAIKMRQSLVDRMKGMRDCGCTAVYVLCGCVDTPLLSHLDENEVTYSWYHDLDSLQKWL